MSTTLKQLRTMATMLLMSAAVPACAEPVTFHGITVDKPDAWTVSGTNRGMKLVSADGAVDIWFETYAGDEHAALVNDWLAFWEKNEVVFSGEPTVGTGKIGAFDESFRLYHDGSATWKGKPSVVEFTEIGPISPDGEKVQMTLWATPESLKAADDDVAQVLRGFAATGEGAR